MHRNAPKSFQLPLHIASKEGDSDLLKLCIQISESENLRQDLDDLLDNCDFSQHYQIFEEFWTQKRTEINEKNGNGLTPLQLASQMGHLQVNNYYLSYLIITQSA